MPPSPKRCARSYWTGSCGDSFPLPKHPVLSCNHWQKEKQPKPRVRGKVLLIQSTQAMLVTPHPAAGGSKASGGRKIRGSYQPKGEKVWDINPCTKFPSRNIQLPTHQGENTGSVHPACSENHCSKRRSPFLSQRDPFHSPQVTQGNSACMAGQTQLCSALKAQPNSHLSQWESFH